MRRDFHGPDDRIRVGFGGVWVLPMPGPTILAIPRRSDQCTGLNVGVHFIARERTGGRPDGPLESLDALVVRAAEMHGTEQPFELAYAE